MKKHSSGKSTKTSCHDILRTLSPSETEKVAGGRKVLTLSGQVNQAVLWWDDGGQTEAVNKRKTLKAVDL